MVIIRGVVDERVIGILILRRFAGSACLASQLYPGIFAGTTRRFLGTDLVAAILDDRIIAASRLKILSQPVTPEE
jgi:hypothetical protein